MPIAFFIGSGYQLIVSVWSVDDAGRIDFEKAGEGARFP